MNMNRFQAVPLFHETKVALLIFKQVSDSGLLIRRLTASHK